MEVFRGEKNSRRFGDVDQKVKHYFYSPFDNLANLRNSFGIQNSLYCHVFAVVEFYEYIVTLYPQIFYLRVVKPS